MCSRKCKASELRRHIKVYHKHQKLSFECTLCGKIYEEGEKKIATDNVKLHEARHTNEMQKNGSFKCNQCPKTFSDSKNIGRHMKNHDKLGWKPF